MDSNNNSVLTAAAGFSVIAGTLYTLPSSAVCVTPMLCLSPVAWGIGGVAIGAWLIKKGLENFCKPSEVYQSGSVIEEPAHVCTSRLISAGEEINEEHSFVSQEGLSNRLYVIKKETDQLSYSITINYLGRMGPAERPAWSLELAELNGATKSTHHFFGSVRLTTKPMGPSVVKIEAQDEFKVFTTYVDISKTPHLRSDRPIGKKESIHLDDFTEGLIRKATIFNPSNDVKIEKILVHPDVGVILYMKGHLDSRIYIANKDFPEFIRCRAELQYCSTKYGYSDWNVTIPGGETHFLSFPHRPITNKDHNPGIIWDNFPLGEVAFQVAS